MNTISKNQYAIIADLLKENGFLITPASNNTYTINNMSGGNLATLSNEEEHEEEHEDEHEHEHDSETSSYLPTENNIISETTSVNNQFESDSSALESKTSSYLPSEQNTISETSALQNGGNLDFSSDDDYDDDEESSLKSIINKINNLNSSKQNGGVFNSDSTLASIYELKNKKNTKISNDLDLNIFKNIKF
jgi:hypothetical protein